MGKSETQLLDAAGKVFAEKGYDRSTVREICSLAGVNVSAVNYYFGDKERLYIEAVKNARHALESWYARCPIRWNSAILKTLYVSSYRRWSTAF